jgi:hypothetical protein
VTPEEVRVIVRTSGEILQRRIEGDLRPPIGHLDIYGALHAVDTCPVCQDHAL